MKEVSAIYDEMTSGVRDSKAKAMQEEKEILKKVAAAKPVAEDKSDPAARDAEQ